MKKPVLLAVPLLALAAGGLAPATASAASAAANGITITSAVVNPQNSSSVIVRFDHACTSLLGVGVSMLYAHQDSAEGTNGFRPVCDGQTHSESVTAISQRGGIVAPTFESGEPAYVSITIVDLSLQPVVSTPQPNKVVLG
ncbi:hypothetical protein KNE206_65400 [Kitasatospora sp. NE20-6]|uniref:hypothetical protein n=1 Tax=Kitasatospora sp. NE20-6 TaxID=2859066 RepID=UPI0034DC691C